MTDLRQLVIFLLLLLLLLVSCCAVSSAAPAAASDGRSSSTSVDEDFSFLLASPLVHRGPGIEETEGPTKPRRSTRSNTPPRRLRPRLNQLNCPIYYFPPPNQHIFCCYKEDFCNCPRPMGVCVGVTLEDLYSGYGQLFR